MVVQGHEFPRRRLHGSFSSSTQLNPSLTPHLTAFSLPIELLNTLQPMTTEFLYINTEAEASEIVPRELYFDLPSVAATQLSISCGLCNISFNSSDDHRYHVQSDLHNYNSRRRIQGLTSISESEFVNLDEALTDSGPESDASSENDDKDTKVGALSDMYVRQDSSRNENDAEMPGKQAGTGPLLWFSTPLLPPNHFLGIYKVLFTSVELASSNYGNVLRQKQLQPIPKKPINCENGDALVSCVKNSVQMFLCMIGGGHFASMVVYICPKQEKDPSGDEELRVTISAHKTFHRYTTRRKQGGSQSTNDSAKGAAHSAGANIRRYNEAALETEVRALLKEWRAMIDESELLFVRATGTRNRRIVYGPYDEQVLRIDDPRNRSFPFSTRRATQAELMRAFAKLTRPKISEIRDAPRGANMAEQKVAQKMPILKSHGLVDPKPSNEEEEALHHTFQLQTLIKRSKAPAVLKYLFTNSLCPDYQFSPPTDPAHYHASTPLHLATSISTAPVIHALLTKANANPTALNGEGRPPFDLAGDRATRDAYRVARFELGEDKWNWEAAHCPPPLPKADADRREAERRELGRIESAHRTAETNSLAREKFRSCNDRASISSPLTMTTVKEEREQETRGLTSQMKVTLERERRARAAEERIRKMTTRLT